MFDDFKKAVLNSYAEKKVKNILSDNLINPTRVKLKNECLDILRNRHLKKDDQTIKAFFDPHNKFITHQESIDKFDLDGFQALITFFKRNINIRKEENIKLLAWLIDFEPRPYEFNKKYNIPEKKESVSKNEKPIDEPILNLLIASAVSWKKIGLTSLLLILAVVLGLTKYSSVDDETGTPSTKDTFQTTNPSPTLSAPNGKNKSNKTNSLSTEKKQCMYWADDHYEPISCDKLLGDTAKVAIDLQKVAHFKKITQPDTLTRNSLGKVWYVKIGGTIEYYTSDGFHPIHTDRKLKKLTDHMLNKYIPSKRP
ncbi:hypothetical protein WG904_02710 [Pedobacter sp. Du54]|uniref:hypothetical protein n=1 Tax=Pedobacter anseongensis TaxID=3133439 RepID=UPI0030984188